MKRLLFCVVLLVEAVMPMVAPAGAPFGYSSGYLLPTTYYQNYSLPQIRRLDFGTATSPVASDNDPYHPY